MRLLNCGPQKCGRKHTDETSYNDLCLLKSDEVQYYYKGMLCPIWLFDNSGELGEIHTWQN